MLQETAVNVMPLSTFTARAPEETGLTFVENALIKARHASAASGLPAIADDSGIAVDALNGEPGVQSARFAGAQASDEENLRKLLDDLRDTASHLRAARYHCALVYMRHARDPAPIVCHATWEGSVATQPIGSGGFGYDPIFIIDGRGTTAAQLSAAQKNAVSHRAKALKQLLAALQCEWAPTS